MSRVLAWFSCGAASAVAAKLALQKYGKRCEVLSCDTFAYEHPDNKRFFKDVRDWLGVDIKILRSEKYIDIYDVFDRTQWLVGPSGARCTTELKKNVRFAYQRPDDLHIFGLTSEEGKRVSKMRENNPELNLEFPLFDSGVDKEACHTLIKFAGIEKPMMYRLGYPNNNCIGCVKAGAGYWNRIRKDFPEIFDKMAKTERRLNTAINKRYEGDTRVRVFLDELDPDAGHGLPEPDIECGVLCNAS